MKKTTELAKVPKPIVQKAPTLRFKYKLLASASGTPRMVGQYNLRRWALLHDIRLDDLQSWATERGLGKVVMVEPTDEDLKEWAKQANVTNDYRTYWKSLTRYLRSINQARSTLNPRLQWLISFFGCNLECDSPVLEALFTALSHLPVHWDWERWLQ